MLLTWLGTAALILRAGDAEAAFDPFAGLPPGSLGQRDRALPDAESFRRADAVFVTHGHFDHIMQIPELYRGLDTPIYVTSAPRASLRRDGVPEERIVTIGPGWTGRVGPLSVTAFPGRHCRFDLPVILRTAARRRFWAHPGYTARLLKLNFSYPQNDEILFYEATDGSVRLQILGSLGLRPDAEYPQGADWLVLPYQGRSDLVRSALKIARRLRPGGILLDHYDDAFPPMSSRIDTGDFCRAAEEELNTPCRALVRGETVRLERKGAV